MAKIAKLSQLTLTDDELAETTDRLDDMLAHFADIDNLDLSGIEPMIQPFPMVNVMRPDVAAPTLDRDTVMAEAPKHEDGQFWVPPSIGGDS